MAIKDIIRKFDKEFKFTGIEHQLEGFALSEDLKSFIRSAIKQAFEATRVENKWKGDGLLITRGEAFEEVLTEVKEKQEEFLNN